MDFDWSELQDYTVRTLVMLLVISVSSMFLLISLNTLGLTSVDVLDPWNLAAAFVLIASLGGIKICFDKCA